MKFLRVLPWLLMLLLAVIAWRFTVSGDGARVEQTGAATPAVSTEPTAVPSAPPATPETAPSPAPAAPVTTLFGTRGPVTIDDVPAGRFRDQLLQLTPEARERALATLGRLQVPINDVGSLSADINGRLFYQCHKPETAAAIESATSAPVSTSAASVAIATPPVRHSRPGAARVLYLDFNGHTVTGTRWNLANPGAGLPAVASYVCRPYNTDSDPTTFSDAEQAAIVEIWQRVAEDFSPFDVDVTTEEPVVFGTQTLRALITTGTDANGVANPFSAVAAGVAYLDIFGEADMAAHSPAFIYYDAVSGLALLAEVISHELGHNLALTHDGTISQEYYRGHGTWGPIMGASYGRTLTQWSKGEYFLANNPQDDMAILGARLAYRGDVAGGSLMTAMPLSTSGNAVSASGVLLRAGESHLHSISTATGRISFSVAPVSYGNADIRLELLDAGGNALALDDPAENTGGMITTTNSVAAGAYYIRVTAAGTGSPMANPPSGYTAYGSVGQYSLSGEVVGAAPIITSASSTSVGVGNAFAYQIATAGYAGTYGASGLPAGLAIDPASGLISGRPTVVGTYPVTLSATNTLGTGTATLTLSVTDAPPVVSAATATSFVLTPGGPAALGATAFSVNGAVRYQWIRNGRSLPGATTANYTATAGANGGYDAYWVEATNDIGTTRSSPFFVRVAPAVTRVQSWSTNNSNGQANVPVGLGRVVDIAAGGSSSISLAADGSLRAWGGYTALPSSGVGAVAVAAGSSFFAVLRADGSVAVQPGNDSYASTANLLNSSQLAQLRDAVAISAGDNHLLVLKTDGTVVGWRPFSYSPSSEPAVPPAGLVGVVAIAAGGSRSMALRADGTVVSWGEGAGNQPVALAGVVAMATSSSRSLVLKSGGTTVGWGGGTAAPTTLPDGTTLAVGSIGAYAVTPDGNVTAWSTSGAAAQPPASLAPVRKLSVGGSHVLALVDGSAESAPTIVTPPADALRSIGASHTFTVAATGPGALGYQWRRNGSPISGATAATYTIAAVQLGDAGSYDVVVSNHVGSITSAVATLTVEAPPAVVTAPASSVSVAPGAPLTLSATATTANGPLTYQWKKNNRPLPGATGSTLTLPSFSAADAGAYVLEITDGRGHRTRTLTFVRPEFGATQVRVWGPNYGNVATPVEPPADAVAFTSASSVALALRRDGRLAVWGDGANTALRNAFASVTTAVAIDSREDAFHVLRADGRMLRFLPNGSSTVESYADVIAFSASDYLTAVLLADGTVRVAGSYSTPAIPAGLGNVTAVAAGSSHVLALQLDGTVVAFGSNTYGQCNVPVSLTGVVAVAAGSNTSVALKSDGTVVAWGENVNGLTNVPGDLGPVSAISVNYNYVLALRSDGTPRIWGSIDTAYTRIPTPATNLVALGDGSRNPAFIRATLGDAAPSITRQPASIATASGVPQRFTVLATGVGPLRYQWRKNGLPLEGRTQDYLDLIDPQSADAASYDVVVSNHVGSVTSATATLTLVTPPVITVPSARRFLAVTGQQVRLTVGASSSFGPLTYQWKKNNRPLPGANTATYEIAAFTPADAGAYTLDVTDSRGAVTRATTFVVADLGPTQVRVWNDYVAYPPPADLAAVIALRRFNTAIQRSGRLAAWNSGGYVSTALPASEIPIVDALQEPNSSSTTPSWLALRADGVVVGSTNAAAFRLAANIPANLRGVIALAPGSYLSDALALASDGRVYRWDASGQLSVLATGDAPVSAVAAGGSHVAFLRIDGTVGVSGGNNSSGQLDVPAGLAGVTTIAAGDNHTLALKSDGTVVAWGSNASRQCNVPSGLAGVVTIGAISSHSFALKSDGTLVRWGGNLFTHTTTTAAYQPVLAFSADYSDPLLLRSAAADTAPVIGIQPSGGGLRAVGDSFTLRVTATGSGALAYQWRRDGTAIAGANQAALTLSPLQLTDAGNYDVVVTNHIGRAVSVGVALQVAAPPVLNTTASARQIVALDSPLSVTFNATSDSGPLAFQWKKDNRPLPGATTATLSLPAVSRADAGAYTLEATDTRGLVTRSTVFVLPSGPAQVRAWGRNDSGQTSIPDSALVGALAVAAGDSVSYALLPGGTVAGWGRLSGSSTARVPASLGDVVALSTSSYYALGLRADGTVAYWTAHIDRVLAAPVRDIVAVSAGTFTAAALRADGSVAIINSYGDLIDTLPAADGPFVAVAAGHYHVLALRLDGTVRAWIRPNAGYTVPAQVPTGLANVVSVAAGGNRSLALRGDGSLASWGDDARLQAIGPGGATAIAAGSGGAGALLSEGTLGVWSSSSSDIRAVPADLGTVAQFSLGTSHGLALVAGGAGTAPTITRPPVSLTRAPGDFALFDVAATGTGTLTYQWRKNGTALTGAITPTLVLPSLQSADAASYDVIVSNAFGSVTSAAATLAVDAGPQVTVAPPARVAVSLGTPVTLTGAATSSHTPLSYQWKKDNRPLAGATSATLPLGNLTAAQAGAYTLEITDARGAVARATSFVLVSRPNTQLRIYGEAGYYGLTNPPPGLGANAVTATLASSTVSVTRADGTVAFWAPSSASSTSPAVIVPGLTDAVTAVSDDSRIIALRADGTVCYWRSGNASPTTIAGLSNAIALATRSGALLALRSNGTVVEYLYNYTTGTYGSTQSSTAFNTHGARLRDIVSISVDSSTTVAVRLDGTVAAWTGSSSAPATVTQASTARSVAQVALNSNVAIALRTDGALTSWGSSSDSLRVVPTFGDALAVAVGHSHALALRADGSVAGWGSNSFGATQFPAGPIGAFAIRASENRTLILRDTSGDAAPVITAQPAGQSLPLGANATFTVVASGPGPFTYQWRRDGQAIAGATAATLVVPAVTAVDAAVYDVVVSNHAGSVTSSPAALVVAIPVTFASSPTPRQLVTHGAPLALTHALLNPAPGYTCRWYFNNRLIAGATELSYTIPAVTDQTAGAYTLAVTSAAGGTTRITTFVLMDSGLTRVRAWGSSNYGQTSVPAGLGDAIAVSAGTDHALALCADGTVRAWGSNNQNQCNVPAGLRDVVAVAAGNSSSLALRADGTVVSWGNSFASNIPTGLRDVIALSLDGSRAVALKSDGTAVVWGDYSSSSVPAAAADLVSVAAGSSHIIALKSDGTVIAWGYSGSVSSSVNVPSALSDVVTIAAGGGQSAALTGSGRLTVWGDNSSSVALGATPVSHIDFGSNYGLALTADGKWLHWGGNSTDLRAVPADISNVLALSAGGSFALALCDAAGDTAPTITVQPQDALVAPDSRAVFTVAATGPGQLSYQWRRNGSPIADATGASLVLADVGAAQVGSYDVMVTSHAGSVTSRAATLALGTPPAFATRPPARSIVAPGESVTLTGAATTDYGPVVYRWKKNNRVIDGATTASLTLGNFTAADAGAYTLEATDARGLTARTTTFVLPDFSRTEVVAFGNSSLTTGIPADLHDAIAVVAGDYYNAALRRDGTVAVWSGSSSSSAVANKPASLSNVVALEGGSDWLLALRADGTVVGWGSNSSGLLTPPAAVRDVIALASNSAVALAVRSDGSVVTWGSSSSGSPIRMLPSFAAEVSSVATGGSYAFAVTADGSIVAWGTGSYGETNLPADLGRVSAVATGSYHSLALRENGTLAVWGSDYFNLRTLPSGAFTKIASAAYRAAAIRTDGTLALWGNSSGYGENTPPANIGGFVDVSLSNSHTLALRRSAADALPVITTQPASAVVARDSTVILTVAATSVRPPSYQWRRNGTALSGATSANLTLTNVQDSASGDYDVLVTNSAGTVTSSVATLTVSTPPAITSAPAARQLVALGASRTLAFAATTAQGPLTYRWKKDNRLIPGATTASLTLANFTAAAAGAYTLEIVDALGVVTRATTFVLPDFGRTQVRVWGSNTSGQLNLPDTVGDVVALSAGGYHTLALRNDGTVAVWGSNNHSSQNAPAGLSNVVAVAAGEYSSLALKQDGTVAGWGGNGYTPAGLRDVIAIATGSTKQMALRSDGTVATWSSQSLDPGSSLPAGLTDVVAIAAGRSHQLALKSDGTVIGWGANAGATVPAGLSGVVAISAGNDLSVAFKADGTIVAWGQYADSTPTGLRAIDCGDSYTIALRTDGTLIGWGFAPYSGETVIPADLGVVRAFSAGFDHVAVIRDANADSAPELTAGPLSVALNAGVEHTFTVSATGVGPISYQWFKNDQPVAGATAAAFTLTSVAPNDVASYTVRVANHIGSRISGPAALTLLAPPNFTLVPARRVAASPGQSVVLSAAAVGASPSSGALAYRWKKNNRPITGATNATLTLPSFSFTDAGAYTLEVTDSLGAVARHTTFILPQGVGTQVRTWGNGAASPPADLVDAVKIALPRTAAGGVALRAGGRFVAWGNDNLLPPVGLDRVVDFAIGGSGNTIALRDDQGIVTYGSGVTTTPPASATDVIAVAAGSSAFLALRADGRVVAWPISGYDYYKQSVVPAGLKGVVAIAAFGDTAAALTDTGDMVLWGYYGRTPPLDFRGQVDFTLGERHALGRRADGTLIAWQIDYGYYGAAVVPGDLGAVTGFAAGFETTAAIRSDGTVRAWGSSGNGLTTVPSGLANVIGLSLSNSTAAALRLTATDAAPVIATHPASANLGVGARLDLSVVATGTGPLAYQWRRDGVAIAGANASSYSIASIGLAAAGSYDVVVSNHRGTVTSAAATVAVSAPPTIVTAPTQRVLVNPGQPVALSVSASTSAGPLTYRWKKNNRVIAGATAATYTIPSSTFADGGAYTVEVSDAAGRVSRRTSFVLVAPSATQFVGFGDPGYSVNLIQLPATISGPLLAIAAAGSTNLVLKADGTVAGWGDNSSAQTPPAGLGEVVALSTAGDYSLALKADGTVVFWGPSYLGVNQPPAGLTDVVAISATSSHALALKSDGTVVTWGATSGSLAVPASLSDVVNIFAYSGYSCAVKADGSVVVWGSPSNNLDIGASSVSGATKAVGSYYAALALKSNGTVAAWGSNSYYQTSVPSGLSGVVDLAIDHYHALALKADGTVVAWGYNNFGSTSVPTGLSGVFAIDAGNSRSLVLRDAGSDSAPTITAQPLALDLVEGATATFNVTATGSGTLAYQWRRNGTPLAGATSASLSLAGITPGQAGSYDVVVTNHVGSVTSTARALTVRALPAVSTQSECRVVAAPGGSAQFTVSATGTGALSYQWRRNGVPISGATSPTLSLTNLTRADAGWYVCAVTDDNGTRLAPPQWLNVAPTRTQIVAWGANSSGQATAPSGLTDVIALAAGSSRSLALRRDGAVAAWGSTSSLSGNSALAGVVSVAAENDGFYTLHDDGTLRRWGSYSLPTWPMGQPVVAVSVSGNAAIALRADGTALTWNPYSSSITTAPAEAASLSRVAAANSFFVGLKTDGTLIQWGSPPQSIPSGLADIRGIAAGSDHVLALKPDGTVVAWGGNSFGQCNVPLDLAGVVAVSATNYTSFALKSDGTIVAWGRNTDGERMLPANANSCFALAAAGAANHMLALRDTSADSAPTIVTAPASLVAATGERVVLTVTAGGQGPFTYVWRRNGVVVAGATAATLVFDPVATTDAGSYTVEVSNHIGSVVSVAAILTVENAPTFTLRPTTRVVGTSGATVTLTAAATSAYLPITYQWNKDNRPITGATSATLTLTNFTNTDAGAYTLVATDSRGHKSYATSFVLPSYGPVQVRGFLSYIVPPVDLGAVIDLAGGSSTNLALRSDGTLATWGGGLGNPPAGLADFVRIAGTNGHALALRADGTIVGFGNNYYGEITVPARATNVVAIAMGLYHSLALRADGSVIAWGRNDFRQCDVPAGLTGVVAIAASGNLSAAVKADGTVAVWGDSSSGATAVPGGLNAVTSIALGSAHALALKSDGTVVAWGSNSSGQTTIPSGLSGIVEIAAGSFTSAARSFSSVVSIWGAGSYNNNPTGLGTVHALRIDNDQPLLLRDASADTVPVISTQPTSVSVASGTYSTSFSVVATGNGPFTYQWRFNSTPILYATSSTLYLYNLGASSVGAYDVVVTNHVGNVTSNVATLSITGVSGGNAPVIAVPASSRVAATVGQSVTLTLSATGSGTLTYQWFRNNRPISGATSPSLTLPTFSLADAGAYTLAVTDSANNISRRTLFVLPVVTSSFVLGAGNDSFGQATPPGTLTDAIAVSAGETHSLALRANGTVMAWGNNQQSQSTVPAGLASVVAVSAGTYHNLALKSDGTVVGWGPSSSNVITGGANLRNLIAVAAGMNFSVGLRDDGSVASWSSNYYSTPALTNAVAIAAGADHAVALRLDGTVSAWGDNTYGQTGIPSGLAGVTAIATGYRHTLALKSDGTLVAWGRNHVGQTTVPVAPAGFVAIRAGANWSAARAADGTWQFWGEAPDTGYAASTSLGTPVDVSWGARHALQVFDTASLQLPIVVTHPQSETVAAGSGIDLRVVAVGPGPLAYQWRRNGVALADGATRTGSTSATLRLTNFASTDAGHYTVVVSNGHGSVSSITAVLAFGATAQTIDFTALADRTYTTTPIALSATASSGLPVSFTLVSGPAALNGTQLTLTGSGSVVIRATQAGNATYAAAAHVERSFNVAKAAATIALSGLSRTYDGTPRTVSATTAPTTLAVNISYDGRPDAPAAVGIYSVHATIEDPNFAGFASGTLEITRASQAITFAPLSDRYFTLDAIPLTATSSSGLTVGFSLLNGAGRIEGASLLLNGTGTFTVRASQAGDDNYASADPVDRSFTVTGSFDSWALGHFSAEELLNPAISGPRADPDRDGYANLVEYALGFNPRTVTTAGLPEVARTSTHWTFTYTRPASRGDVAVIVESSTNLTSWSDANVTLTRIATGATETWQATVPVSAGANLFFRLKVTR